MTAVSNLDAHRPRRKVIPVVDARFQWKYTLLVTALGVGVSAIMGGFLYRAHAQSTRLLDISPKLQEQALLNDQIFLLMVIVSVIAMGIVLALWGLVITHRISGPLYIVARYLDVMADGAYPDVRPLRKKDELQEFFASFEEAVNAMRHRDMINLKDLDAALENDDASTSKKLLGKVRASLARSLGTANGVDVE